MHICRSSVALIKRGALTNNRKELSLVLNWLHTVTTTTAKLVENH